MLRNMESIMGTIIAPRGLEWGHEDRSHSRACKVLREIQNKVWKLAPAKKWKNFIWERVAVVVQEVICLLWALSQNTHTDWLNDSFMPCSWSSKRSWGISVDPYDKTCTGTPAAVRPLIESWEMLTKQMDPMVEREKKFDTQAKEWGGKNRFNFGSWYEISKSHLPEANSECLRQRNTRDRTLQSRCATARPVSSLNYLAPFYNRKNRTKHVLREGSHHSMAQIVQVNLDCRHLTVIR